MVDTLGPKVCKVYKYDLGWAIWMARVWVSKSSGKPGPARSVPANPPQRPATAAQDLPAATPQGGWVDGFAGESRINDVYTDLKINRYIYIYTYTYINTYC